MNPERPPRQIVQRNLPLPRWQKGPWGCTNQAARSSCRLICAFIPMQQLNLLQRASTPPSHPQPRQHLQQGSTRAIDQHIHRRACAIGKKCLMKLICRGHQHRPYHGHRMGPCETAMQRLSKSRRHPKGAEPAQRKNPVAQEVPALADDEMPSPPLRPSKWAEKELEETLQRLARVIRTKRYRRFL